MGNILIYIGIFLVLAGVAYKAGLLNWFGNLPGDIKIENDKTKIYFPITTMIVVSVALSLLLSFFRR
ncbi:MAG: DUF2905 domain-containing protein [Campylobacterales bacterium]